MKPYGWHASAWASLLSDAGRLPHALLLGGPGGLGKTAFGEALAARLLCEQIGDSTGSFACGGCHSCNWLSGGNHPDFRLVQPEDGGGEDAAEDVADVAKVESPVRKSGQGQVRVEQIRALEDFVFVGSHRLGNRVVLISQAETMNAAAANSLLKILEEPPLSVYFILISSNWRRLLPTLLSRCRTVILGYPDSEVAKQWLTDQGISEAAQLLYLAGGIPLLAADWGEKGRLESYSSLIETLLGEVSDPVAMAAKWATLLKAGQGFSLPQLVEAIQKWVVDLGLQKMTGSCRYHRAWQDQLAKLVGSASAPGIIGCYNELLRIRAVARHPLNTQLFLEDLAARYLRALTPGKA